MQLLSEPWIEQYGKLWNEDPVIRQGLEDITTTIVYRVAEDPENRAGQLDVVNGEVVYAGVLRAADPEFLLTASVDNWRAFGDGKLRVQKALTFKKLKFEGPVMVALTHLSPLEAALRLFGSVDGTEWS
jgi:putative sterol carrier protein